jgi:hypothetical protein
MLEITGSRPIASAFVVYTVLAFCGLPVAALFWIIYLSCAWLDFGGKAGGCRAGRVRSSWVRPGGVASGSGNDVQKGALPVAGRVQTLSDDSVSCDKITAQPSE